MNEIFLFLGSLCLICSVLVISVKNPVHSVLSLTFTFITATGLLLLLEVDFIALIFVVVYAGAIAILFLFVVMMLDIKISDNKHKLFKYFPVGSFIGSIFLILIFFFISNVYPENPYVLDFLINDSYINWVNIRKIASNIEVIGSVLYTYYIVQFLVVGIILLVAVIGAVVLTINYTNKIKKEQKINKQVIRNFNNAVFFIK